MALNGTLLVYKILFGDTKLFGDIRAYLALPVTGGPYELLFPDYEGQCQAVKEIVINEFDAEGTGLSVCALVDGVLDSVEWDFLLDLVLEGHDYGN
jgi:hypothetical protein